MAVLYDLVVTLVPRSHSSESRTREPGERVPIQPVDNEAHDIGEEGGCEHRQCAGADNQVGKWRGHVLSVGVAGIWWSQK